MPARSLDPLVAIAAEGVQAVVPSAVALVLGGSHARGEPRDASVDGRIVRLSDLDFHLVVADEPARAAARRALSAARAGIEARLRERSMAAPLEIGVHTRTEWEHLPARPATLELRALGCVLWGDEHARNWLPDWRPTDVSAEEIRLLLENRAFELIASRPEPGLRRDAAADRRAAHAQYKTALDLATIELLHAGEWESDPELRVRRARALRAPGLAEPAWEAALAWNRGGDAPSDRRAEDWWVIARGWVAAWNAESPARDSGAGFEDVALHSARRARPRRRLRMAFAPEMAAGCAPALAERLRFAAAGTPQHRLNASAGAFLAAEVAAHDAPGDSAALRARLDRVLLTLGAVPPGPAGTVAAALLDRWRRWVVGESRGVPAS